MNLMKRALVRLVVTTIVLSNFITILKVELWIMVLPNMVMNVTVKHMKAYMKIGNQAKSTSCRT